MKVLLITQWFPPEPQKLLSDLAQGLQDCGHEVTVLTGFPNWPEGRVYPPYRIRPWQREICEGVPVTRIALYPNHSRSAAKRIANYVSFSASVAVQAPYLVSRPDIIHVVHPPLTVGLAGYWLSRVWRLPFTFEIQDMWPETLAATGMLNNVRALAMVGHLAKWVYRRAAAIRVISPGFRQNLIEKGVLADKVHYISNWVDTDFYRPLAPDPDLAQQFGLAGRFNIMFAGVIGLAQGLDTVLAAADLLRDLPAVQFVLLGDGVDLERLRGIAAERSLNNVCFLGRRPGSAMPDFYALADVLLVHLRDDPLFRITIPHKTFTYLASGKPVLAAVAGDVAAVVESARAGLICPPGDPGALADTVRRVYGMSLDERNALGQNGRRAACAAYSKRHLIGQIAAMLETVVADRRAATCEVT